MRHSWLTKFEVFFLNQLVFSSSLFHFFALLSAAAVYLYHTVRFWRCGSHGTTVVVLERLIFVTATSGASVCAHVRMWAANLNTARDDSNPHFPEFSKASAQYSSGTTLALNLESTRAAQQRHNSIAAAVQHQRILQGSYMIHRNASVSPLQLATPPGFQANHIPKRSLVRAFTT